MQYEHLVLESYVCEKHKEVLPVEQSYTAGLSVIKVPYDSDIDGKYRICNILKCVEKAAFRLQLGFFSVVIPEGE